MTAGIRVSVTQPSAPASMEHNTGLPFGLFRVLNMNSPVIFAGSLTIFPAPRGSPASNFDSLPYLWAVDRLTAAMYTADQECCWPSVSYHQIELK